jgi:AcrR family transcriptional regulator
VARTVNVLARTVRRDAFLDAAQQLIQTKGYEQMSIQDVLDAVDTSRGAFYHYFDSKLELLEAVVERFTDGAMAAVDPILSDSELPALRKLEKMVAGFARLKAESKDLMLALIEVMNSDGNALFREKLRRMSARRLGPILSQIIRQGIREGVVKVAFPDETATVILSMIQGYQVIAGEQFVARQANRISFEEVKRSYAAFTDAIERILGIPAGTIRLVDDATLHFWFG